MGWGNEGGRDGRFGRRHIRLVVRPLSCRLSFISIYNVIMYKRNVQVVLFCYVMRKKKLINKTRTLYLFNNYNGPVILQFPRELRGRNCAT